MNDKRTIPGRPRELAYALLIWLLVGSAVVAAPRVFTFIRLIEVWIADFRLVVMAPEVPPHPDIVLVTVTEDTLAAFPYRSPLDRAFLAGLLQRLQAAGVRAVAIDILFDQPTEAAKDTALAEVVADYPVPLVVAWADLGDGLTKAQVRHLENYLPGVRKAYANLVRDDFDGVVRGLFAGRRTETGIRRGLAGALAEMLGAKPPRSHIALDYRLGQEGKPPFKAFPAHTVALLPPAWFKDKVVLIGADLPHQDRHRTPLATVFGARQGTLNGTAIHAQALAQLLEGRLRPASGLGLEALVAALLALFGLALGRLELALALKAGLGGGLAVLTVALSFALFAAGGPAIPVFAPILGLAAAAGIGTALAARRQRAEKRFIRSAFTRYVSPALVAELQKNPARLELGGERRELSFIFSDIAGFTTLSEQTDPEVLVAALNRYLSGMSDVVMAHGGTVDKYIGDAVVAFFGAPLEQPDHAARALAAALDMDAFARDFEARCAADGLAFGITRIGVHSGTVTVGNFGSESRFDYTAIGDAMNTAARLESLNKHLGTRICISQAVAGSLAPEAVRPVGDLVLKGRREALTVF